MTDPIIKSYPLNISTRIVMVIPGIMLVIFLVFILSTYSGRSPTDWTWWVFVVLIGLGVMITYIGFAMRLTISSDGIRYYFLYPFFNMITWKELDSASQNDFGMVNISLKTVHGKKDWFRIFSNNQLPLSSFVDDWKTSDLISEIQKYTPRVQIPVSFLTRPKLKLWHRPGVILVYYLLSLFFLLLLISLAGIKLLEPIHFSLLQAVIGYETAVFGGMLSLLTYSKWIWSNSSEKFYKLISRNAQWNYILPFSGWIVAFVISLVAQWTSLGWNYTGEATGLNGFIAIVGFLQAGFLPYMKYNRRER